MNIDDTSVHFMRRRFAAKRRRAAADFPGAAVILGQLKDKSYAKRRVGLQADSGRPPRRSLPPSLPPSVHP